MLALLVAGGMLTWMIVELSSAPRAAVDEGGALEGRGADEPVSDGAAAQVLAVECK
jgi:hypothetical protein